VKLGAPMLGLNYTPAAVNIDKSTY